MPDRARSDHPAVQRQLDRLATLSPGGDTLGLTRIRALLARLGNPERRLPPVLHVAGTNGKGSTCAFLRAAVEAAGGTAHVYTSPHLVRFNERVRLAGRLVEDEMLAALLGEVLDAAEGSEVSFFEATTAAAFLAFSRTQADAAIVEVGLGGRLDATNVIEGPAACGIAQLGLDHQAFLGDTLEAITAEKAGIAKPGAPLVTLAYPSNIAAIVADQAAAAGACWLPQGEAWEISTIGETLHYRDAQGELHLPLPGLSGQHQSLNAGLAIAMLRHQSAIAVPPDALAPAVGSARWPARLQRLGAGPLHDLLPSDADLWLDGGHNPDAARAIADHFASAGAPGRPLFIILGLLENKDASGLIEALAPLDATMVGIPVPNHAHHDPQHLAALARSRGLTAHGSDSVEAGLTWAAAQQARAPVILIAGSLYLAGEVLRRNGEVPD